MAKVALLILRLLCVAGVKSISHLKIYEHQNFKGLLFEDEVYPECTNLPERFNDKASSVDSKGTCVFLYDDFNCRGRRFKLEPGHVTKGNLWWFFEEKALSSIRACYPPIPGNTDCCSECPHYSDDESDADLSYFFLQTAKLRIYDYHHQNGLIYEGVPTEECSNLQDIKDRASSVDTLGTCVFLYANYNCRGKLIAVHPGSASHYDLSELKFDNKARSVRACWEQRDWDDFVYSSTA